MNDQNDLLRAERMITRGIRTNTEQTFTPSELEALRSRDDAMRAYVEKLERELEAAYLNKRVTVLLPESLTRIGAN